MNYWPLLILWTGSCKGYNILALLPYPGKSHHMVFEPLLQELANRGHRLTVVSFFPSKNPHPNRREVSLVGLAPLNIEVVDVSEFDSSQYFARYFEHIPVAITLAKMNLELCAKLLDADVFKEFVNSEGDYDVILVEHFNSDCMLGLVHKYGVPSVGLMSCSMMPFTPLRVGGPDNPAYVPVMVLPLTDTMSFVDRLVNAFTLYFYEVWFEIAIRWEEQRILEQKLGLSLPPLSEIGKNASAILVHVHHSLNGVRVLPPSVVEVGGIHLHNRSTQPLPRDLQEWVSDAKSCFIVLSFGSLIKGFTLPAKRVRAILNVFARLPQRVLWKWEAEGLELPNNVRMMRWLPQYELLSHPNCVAFISHAGGLSLTEAVSVGVPMLAIPMLGDQFGNAEHAARAGMAEVLPLRELDERSFEAALRNVLTGRMRSNAKRLSEIWKDRLMDPMDRAVHYVEKTARYNGLNISTTARLLNRLQLALLDVVTFIFAVIVIISTSLILVCRKVKNIML